MNFWNFGWSSEEPEPPPSESPSSTLTATVESDILKPSRGWASVFEGFRAARPASDEAGGGATVSGQHAALRSFTRRAHQLLAKQHQRAWQSRRALALDQAFAQERWSLAAAEAEELEDFLRTWRTCCERDSPTEAGERHSGWSTSASSGGSKASDQLLSRWDCEDAELRSELQALQGAKSHAASELRSSLLRLRRDEAEVEVEVGGVAQVLPQLAQSCADALQGDDAWATCEAQLFEQLAVRSRAAGPAVDPDFTPCGFTDLDEMLFAAMPGSRSAEEQRDQTALQNLLQRIEKLSQRMEQEALGDGERKAKVAAEAAKRRAAKEQRRLFQQARRHLEGQVQKLMEENQALELQLEAEKAARESRLREGDGGPRGKLEKKLSPAERLALSNHARAKGGHGAAPGRKTSGEALPEPNSSQIFGSQRRVLLELRKELAETYEVLALRSLPAAERQLLLARRAAELGKRKGNNPTQQKA